MTGITMQDLDLDALFNTVVRRICGEDCLPSTAIFAAIELRRRARFAQAIEQAQQRQRSMNDDA